jgi:hypothetical protein
MAYSQKPSADKDAALMLERSLLDDVANAIVRYENAYENVR